jgi:predicted transcriptional regulator
LQRLKISFDQADTVIKEKEMMKRSKHVIISRILDICQNGANKTRIVYQANLNFRTVDPYIDLLIKNNLIEIKQGKTILYETTDRGIHLLDDFKQINSQLSEL